MILYLHGFASNENTNKSKILNKHFSELVISPTLEIEPNQAIKQILNILETNDDINQTLIGTSLGAFYGLYILSKMDIPVILINPSLNPGLHLSKHVGINTNFKTNDTFEWTDDYNKQLISMKHEIDTCILPSHYLNFMLSNDDELIDHSDVKNIYNTKTCEYFDNSKHRFTKFEESIPHIKQIINFYKV